jgi:hypothetical protein
LKAPGRPRSPRELWLALTRLFPRFADDCTEDELAEREREGTASFHFVLIPFTQYLGSDFSTVSEKQLRQLADLVNAGVSVDDDLENAVSTRFLEHLAQIRVRTKLAPHLSPEAKRRTRA